MVCMFTRAVHSAVCAPWSAVFAVLRSAFVARALELVAVKTSASREAIVARESEIAVQEVTTPPEGPIVTPMTSRLALRSVKALLVALRAAWVVTTSAWMPWVKLRTSATREMVPQMEK